MNKIYYYEVSFVLSLKSRYHGFRIYVQCTALSSLRVTGGLWSPSHCPHLSNVQLEFS